MSEALGQPRPVLVLDARSRVLLGTRTDVVLIGIIRLSSATIQLFEAAQTNDFGTFQFEGHRELLRSGLVQLDGTLGFSVEIAGGQIRAFYRSSILNRDQEDFAITSDMMLEAIAALGLPRASVFRSYP